MKNIIATLSLGLALSIFAIAAPPAHAHGTAGDDAFFGPSFTISVDDNNGAAVDQTISSNSTAFASETRYSRPTISEFNLSPQWTAPLSIPTPYVPMQ